MLSSNWASAHSSAWNEFLEICRTSQLAYMFGGCHQSALAYELNTATFNNVLFRMKTGTLRMMLHVSTHDEKAKVASQGKEDEQQGRWQQLWWQHPHTQDGHTQQRWTQQMATQHRKQYFAQERTSRHCQKGLLVSLFKPRLSLLNNWKDEESANSNYSAYTKQYTTKMMFRNNRALIGIYFYFLTSRLIRALLPPPLTKNNYSIKSVFARKQQTENSWNNTRLTFIY